MFSHGVGASAGQQKRKRDKLLADMIAGAAELASAAERERRRPS
jgi:hypothetical protein